MVSVFLSRIVVLTAGTLYPAYRSYKAVRTKVITCSNSHRTKFLNRTIYEWNEGGNQTIPTVHYQTVNHTFLVFVPDTFSCYYFWTRLKIVFLEKTLTVLNIFSKVFARPNRVVVIK